MTTMTDGPSGPGGPGTPDLPPPPAWLPPPPPSPAPANRGRTLRRSNTDRVAAGVAGGLGEYFGLDPVLFRVLFAVTSFFGGAGVVAYLLAWILIPDDTTAQAPMDRIAATMRRHRVPFWLVTIVAVFIAWLALFSWWAPGRFGVVAIAVIVLAIVLSRRKTDPAAPTATTGWTSSSSGPSTLDASALAPPTSGDPIYPNAATAPATSQPWLPETRSWINESRARRRRSAPVRWATLGALVLALGGIAIADSISGVVLPVYFWVGGAIVLAGLAVGLITRRTPWSVTVLLVPTVLGLIVFGGTRASLHDGVGQTTLTPTSAAALQNQYRYAFGELDLDLRSLPALDTARTIDITIAGGKVELRLPATLNASVHAKVHAGAVTVDNTGKDDGGFNYTRDVPAPAGASGAPLTINVTVAAGQVNIDRN